MILVINTMGNSSIKSPEFVKPIEFDNKPVYIFDAPGKLTISSAKHDSEQEDESVKVSINYIAADRSILHNAIEAFDRIKLNFVLFDLSNRNMRSSEYKYMSGNGFSYINVDSGKFYIRLNYSIKNIKFCGNLLYVLVTGPYLGTDCKMMIFNIDSVIKSVIVFDIVTNINNCGEIIYYALNDDQVSFGSIYGQVSGKEYNYKLINDWLKKFNNMQLLQMI